MRYYWGKINYFHCEIPGDSLKDGKWYEMFGHFRNLGQQYKDFLR